MSGVSCIEVERLAGFFFFFFTSLLHQSVTRGMSGRDRGMSMWEDGSTERRGRIDDNREEDRDAG